MQRAIIFDLFGVLAVDGSPNKPLFDVIARELRPRYKLGVLSNAGMDWFSKLLTPQQRALFDAAVLSYQIGVSKPDEQAYQLVAQKLGVLPQQCVFIDDIERYCSAAEAVGMHAIHYQTAEQTIDALRRIAPLSQSEK